MEVKIPLDNSSFLSLVSNENCRLDILYRDPEGKIYVTKINDFKNNESIKDFIEKIKKDKPKMPKNDNNEVILEIKSTNEKYPLSLNTTEAPEDTNDPAPIIANETISTEKETPQGDDNDFYKEFEDLKTQKEQMIKKNLELRDEIEKAKKQTDELLRVFYENRAKYYEAEKRNRQITKILEE